MKRIELWYNNFYKGGLREWGMGRDIEMKKLDWVNYADVVGDRNPIHRDDDVAVALGNQYNIPGLDRAIAPGMFVASHIQGADYIGGIHRISFPKVVYEGDVLTLTEKDGKRGVDYTLSRGNDVVCKVDGVNELGGEVVPFVRENFAHVYDAEISSVDVFDFLKSVGYDASRERTPEMLLASLSAPALLDFGREYGVVGMHASQSFNVFDDYVSGEVSVGINAGAEKVMGGVKMQTYDLAWGQGGRKIASGKALVALLGE